jgi:DNA-binding NarL/FixJ family response regulator
MLKKDSSSLISIFLVEDHHIMRRGLASLLTLEQGAHIAGEAASGEEALEKLAGAELPNLIIMDISLAGMNGIETTRAILARYPQARVLVLSMYNNPTFVHQVLEAGALGYILKESMVDELHAAIEAVMSGKIYLSEAVTPKVDFNQKPGSPPYEPLTPREMEVFQRLAAGMSVKDIADDLVVSIYTVYTHISNIKRKLGVEKSADMIRYAIENPLILKPSTFENLS